MSITVVVRKTFDDGWTFADTEEQLLDYFRDDPAQLFDGATWEFLHSEEERE